MIRALSSGVPDWLWLRLMSVFSAIFLSGHSFGWNSESLLFFVSDGKRKRFFSNRSRGLDLYRDGLQKRADKIFDTYCLKNVPLGAGDTVIDCGANYGDLWLSLENKINPENYIGIEPNPEDFRALAANVPDESQLCNLALSNRDGLVHFFVSSAGGDSSAIMPREYSEVIKVQAKRLDTLVQEIGLQSIKLLKLEAEGYEPEILDGAHDTLAITEWIAVDGGPERGVTGEQTLSTVANQLYSLGFIMVDFFPRWSRALFHRVEQANVTRCD